MPRPLTLAALLAIAAALPGGAGADDIYSFVDRDGVIHVTNVPQDRRFRRAAVQPRLRGGVYRVRLDGRATRVGPATLAWASPVGPSAAPRSTVWDDHIRAAADRHGVAPPLLKAVMAAESNFDPWAVSSKGATGLMQLMPATARDMYVSDVLDPAQNIDGGARYLRVLQDRFGGDLEKVLAAYNAGPEAVRRCGGTVPPIPETQAYVRKVIALYDAYMKAAP